MMYRRTAAIGAVAIFALAACSNDNNNTEPTPTPTVTATETETASPSPTSTEGAQGEPFELVCPPPIGTVQVTSGDDQWAPGIVVGTGEDYWPVAFGEITFTDTDTGETHTDPPTTLTGADTTGAVECSFTQTVDTTYENGKPLHGTVVGTVSVVPEKPVRTLPTTS